MTEPDLFADFPPPARRSRPRRSEPIELRAARALAKRMKRTPARPDKQRIAHQICESLKALCKRGRA